MLQPKKDLKNLRVFTDALERFKDSFAIYDRNYKLIFANSAAYDAMPAYFNALDSGRSIEEAHRAQVHQFFPEMPEPMLTEKSAAIVERFYYGSIYEIGITKNRTIQVRHETLNEHYTLALGIDISTIKSQQAEMESLAEENHRLANTDQLTGLANRRQFIKSLEDRIARCELGGCAFYVGLIDLNGFKRVNDVYGHAVGDELLTGVAQRASAYIEEETFLARLGGDEFALITPVNESYLDLVARSAGLCEVLRQPQHLSGNDISVSASLGWAAYPTDGTTASELLQKSDYALYKAKYSDAQKTVVFSDTDEEVLNREAELTRQMQIADMEDQIFLEFQPIFETQSNRIIGLEALTRWDSPVLGLVCPAEFIPLAEKTGTINHLTRIILKKALSQAIHWPKSVELHINISAVDLGRLEVISDLIDIIQLSAYPAQSVVFEVTETAVVDTFENTSETFDLIKSSGVRLALDDFGKGFSSFSYLTRLPVTCLKVDKYFTERLKPNSDDEKILRTILYMCETLGIDCIIEGVETRSQLNQLIALGANNMQGYYFSKSLKPENLAAFMLRYGMSHRLEGLFEPVRKPPRVA